MPAGTVTRKIARQPSRGDQQPPSDGPSAVPIADIVPSRPMARPVPAVGNGLADHGHRERQHDRRAEPLGGSRGDQRRERGRDAAEGRGGREEGDARDQQPAAAGEVTQRPTLTIRAVLASR